MASAIIRRYSIGLHPIHAALVMWSIPLFLGALLSDWAYAASYQVQWTNFSSWLIAGGLVFVGLASLWALIDVLRARVRRGRAAAYLLALLATFAIGFVNALVHAKDAWASMPTGMILSAVTTLLAIIAAWIGLANGRDGGRP